MTGQGGKSNRRVDRVFGRQTQAALTAAACVVASIAPASAFAGGSDEVVEGTAAPNSAAAETEIEQTDAVQVREATDAELTGSGETATAPVQKVAQAVGQQAASTDTTGSTPQQPVATPEPGTAPVAEVAMPDHTQSAAEEPPAQAAPSPVAM